MAKASFRWLRIGGVLLFIWIAYQIDWMRVWRLLAEIQAVYVVAYFAAFLIAVLLKIFRMRWFLKCLGYSVAFKNVYRSVIEPAFYGSVTPARLGEFSKVLFLQRFGLGTRLAWGVVLMERLVDVSVLLIAGAAGLIYFTISDDAKANLALAAFLVLAVLLFAGLTRLGALARLGSGVLARISWNDGAFADVLNLKEGLDRIGKFSAIIVLPISGIALLLSFLQLWFLGLALNVSVSGIYLGLAYVYSSLVAVLSLSVGGMGTREAVYIGLLYTQGVSPDVAITISLLDGLVLSLLAQLILFLPLAFKRGGNEKD